MSEQKVEPRNVLPWSVEQFLRKSFRQVIDPVADFLLKVGLKADHVTLFGLLLFIGAACLIAFGKTTAAGLVLLVAGPLDVIDGAMARKQGELTKFGAFLDSVIDRYSELVLFCGLIIYYASLTDMTGIILTFIAASGSVLVSYIRARAESLGFSAKVGLLTRVERMIVMILFLLIGKPVIALWVIAILANVTAIQRILYVHKHVQTQ